MESYTIKKFTVRAFNIENQNDCRIDVNEIYDNEQYSLLIFDKYNNRIYKHTQSYFTEDDYYLFSLLIELDFNKLFTIDVNIKNNNVIVKLNIKKKFIDSLLKSKYYVNNNLNRLFDKSNEFNFNEIKFHKLNNKYKKLKCEEMLNHQLFLYQNINVNWMCNVETLSIKKKKKPFSLINYTNVKKYEFSDKLICKKNNYLFDNKLLKEKIKFNFKGGVLHDEVGLGKTFTFISLILEHPVINIKENESKATILICPPRLCSQWKNEIKKFIKKTKKLKIFVINSIVKFRKIKLEDFKEADVVIISLPFLSNKNYLSQNKFRLTQLKWHRIIVDEGHEYLNSKYKHVDKILELNSTYKWICTGTPFAYKHDSLDYICSFLTNNQLKKHNNIDDENMKKIIKIYFHHNTKKSVKELLNIPKIIEITKFLKQSPIEQAIYNNAKGNKEKQIELCTHVLVESFKKNDSKGEILTLEQIHDQLSIKYKNEIKQLKTVINKNENDQKMYKILIVPIENIKPKDRTDTEKVEIGVYKTHVRTLKEKIKKNTIILRNKVRQFNLFSDLDALKEKINQYKEEECCICMGANEDMTIAIANCGHIFCRKCILDLYKYSGKNYINCPICRVQLTKESIKFIDESVKQENVNKYGTKMAYLLTYLQILFANEESKIIIFSKFNFMLNLVSKVLIENSIKFVNIKGNVFVKTKAIERFKTDKDTKIIMLSSDSCSSGSNLTEASHIILLDTFNGDDIKTVKDTEEQAIGRAVRLGQTKRVEIVRLIMENTIEHDYYNKYFN